MATDDPALNDAPPREIPIPTRAPSTTIDALEKEFPARSSANLKRPPAWPAAATAASPRQRRTGEKVGRNDPCPCGSGKKYKKCHGAEA